MDTDNTTDGMWETTDANITVNKWWFIAWQSATENTTVAGQWRVWVGDIDTAPTARTVVNTTARSGNYTSGTTLYIGNRGTTSQSFFGGIGWVSSLVVNGAAINCYSTIATSGAIDAAQELNIYNRWVLPMWLGQPNAEFFKQGQTAGDLSAIHVDLDRPLPLAGQLTGTTSGNPATTTIVSTATFSQSRSPRPMPRQWVIERPFTPSQRR